MTEVVYCNIEKYMNENWQEMLERIPENLHRDILRYKKYEDRLSRLLARIMLQDVLIARGYSPSLLIDFQRNKHNRPCLPIAEDFSISHSGSYVLLAFSDHSVGIDVEKKVMLDWRDYKDYFHAEESQYIENSLEPLITFYKIWTRKEAALKLLGKGIVDGLGCFSCLQDNFIFNDRKGWFYELRLDEEYGACLSCSIEQKEEDLSIRLFSPWD